MLPKIVTMLPSFLSYLVVAMLLLTGFLLIYVKVTPYDEIDLIRKGNVAAAISLSGALLGFAMPVANVIAHSVVQIGPPSLCTIFSAVVATGRSSRFTEAYPALMDGMPIAPIPAPRRNSAPARSEKADPRRARNTSSRAPANAASAPQFAPLMRKERA